MNVPAAEDDLVVVNQPDVLVDDILEVAQASARLVDVEANGLQERITQRVARRRHFNFLP